MKKLIAMVISLSFILVFVALGFTAEKATDKCVACHKGEKALDKVLQKKKIKTVADFMKAIKGCPTAKVHARFNDNDIKAVAKELKLAK
jgi:hypothetical protein